MLIHYKDRWASVAVIPAQAEIRTRPHGNPYPVIPTKVGI
ncbi:hypothetical protein NMH_1548 [Neisseria meningitidis H44/76]|uniref:Uncharacterized protein n=6 Tax=Neisseria meningitidis TaxID=487 RepID=A0A0H5QUK7_NEIMI|nr:hypothetical protein NMA510612_0723 [Neisseria meningitidis]EFV63385.1 hypothetical protein NMH_1548 [Neisseria meningitidis H44/76]KER39018.1 hypothetical protein F528_2015 [Neisseria meningitidis 992008]CBA04559.1 hypothetical protein predicted by Glimmer/Critica [Neisseria meningitidis alpha275]CBA04822.1 hypothetical protein predicted by Glimmer/Critica [Neisseria meningitidis alpha153]CCA45412.1 hypothetical protein NMALPHA522_1871 [Neisseria meningitidis alpha522]CRY99328.1 hypotheti